MAAEGDSRFGRTAYRWVERFKTERDASVEEIEAVACALVMMRLSPDDDGAWTTLVDIVGLGLRSH